MLCGSTDNGIFSPPMLKVAYSISSRTSSKFMASPFERLVINSIALIGAIRLFALCNRKIYARTEAYFGS